MGRKRNIDYDRLNKEARDSLKDQWAEDNERLFNILLRADDLGHTTWVKAIEDEREKYIEAGWDETVDAIMDYEYEQEDPYGYRGLRRSDF